MMQYSFIYSVQHYNYIGHYGCFKHYRGNFKQALSIMCIISLAPTAIDSILMADVTEVRMFNLCGVLLHTSVY